MFALRCQPRSSNGNSPVPFRNQTVDGEEIDYVDNFVRSHGTEIQT